MQGIEPQMRNCASGNLEIPGSRFARPGMTRELADASKSEIRRDAALPRGFLSVARHGVAVPGQAPIVGALGGPDEIARMQKMGEGPGAVIVDIADEAEFAAGLQHARHRG